jgi:hypothetical protein
LLNIHAGTSSRVFSGEFFKLVSLKGWNIAMYSTRRYEQLEEIPVKRGEIHEPRI